jgi:hypothetical protein
VTDAEISIELRASLFQLLPAFHWNKLDNRNKQAASSLAFSKAKAAIALGARSTPGRASRSFA